MEKITTSLQDVVLLKPTIHEDERGFFSQLLNKQELATHSLPADFSFSALSFNQKSGTVRGLHFQQAPHAQAKYVRCTKGAIFDVVLDLRENSETFGQWTSFELAHDELSILYIPKGCAHGFQTLVDNSEIEYHIVGEYHRESEQGIHYQSSELAIHWPIPKVIINERDENWPLFKLD